MGDPNRGIYHKFNIERTDGTSIEGGKHHGCDYFVLDVTHDPFALPALRSYAEVCRPQYPLLAADLDAKVGEAAALPASSAPNGLYGESHLKCHGEDHLFPRFNPIRCQCGAREGAAEYKMEAAALPSSTAPDAYTQWLGRWSLVHGSGATPTLKDAFDGGVALLSAPSSTAPIGCISGCEDGTVTADVRALCPVHGKSTEQRVDASWLKVARENLDAMLAHVDDLKVCGKWPNGYEIMGKDLKHMLRAERDEADKSIAHAAKEAHGPETLSEVSRSAVSDERAMHESEVCGREVSTGREVSVDRLNGGEIRDILQAVWRKMPENPELRAELQQEILDIVNRGVAHAAKEEVVSKDDWSVPCNPSKSTRNWCVAHHCYLTTCEQLRAESEAAHAAPSSTGTDLIDELSARIARWCADPNAKEDALSFIVTTIQPAIERILAALAPSAAKE